MENSDKSPNYEENNCLLPTEMDIHTLLQFYESIIDNANVWLMFIDTNDNIIVWNRAAEKISGYLSEEVIQNNTIWKLIYPDVAYRKKITNEITNIIQNKKELEHFETQIIAKNRQTRYISWNTRALIDKSDLVYGYIAIGNDITDKIQATKEIKRVGHEWQTTFDALQDPVFLLDINGRIVRANLATSKLFGISPEAIIGKACHEIVHSSPDFPETCPFKKAIRSLKRESHIFDFAEFVFKGTVDPIFDENGELIGAIDVITNITEQIHLLEELKVSQRNLSTLMSNLIGMAYRCQADKNGIMEFVSDGCLDLTGYSPSELIGNDKSTFMNLIHAEDRDDVSKTIFMAVNKHQSFRVIYRINTISGEEKWVLEQGRGVYKKNGDLIELEGFIIDITSQKKVEMDLKIKEIAIASFISGVIFVDLDGIITYANAAAVKMWGYESARDVVGKSSRSFWKNPAEVLNVESEIHNSGASIGEMVAVRKDGSTFDVYYSVTLIEDDSGSPICVLGSFVDITERKKAQETVNYLSDIVKSSNDAIIGLSLDGTILSWNEGAQKIYGYTPGEVIGKDISIAIPEERRSNKLIVLKKIKNGRNTDNYETEGLSKSGKKISVSLSFSAIRDNNSNISGVSIIGRDISYDKEMMKVMIGYITEGALRLKNPVEIVRDNLEDILRQIDSEDLDEEDLKVLLRIQIKNSEQIIHNLRELNQAIIGSFGEIPEEYKKFLSR